MKQLLSIQASHHIPVKILKVWVRQTEVDVIVFSLVVFTVYITKVVLHTNARAGAKK